MHDWMIASRVWSLHEEVMVVTLVIFCFLQMFVCERFSVVALKQMEYPEVTMKEVVPPNGLRRILIH